MIQVHLADPPSPGTSDSLYAQKKYRDSGLEQLAPSKRSGRVRFATAGITGARLKSYQGQLPSLFPTLPGDLRPYTADAAPASRPTLQSVPTKLSGDGAGQVVWLKSPLDEYGLYREYPTRPSFIPSYRSVEEIADGPFLSSKPPARSFDGRSGVGGHPTTKGLTSHTSSVDATIGSSVSPATAQRDVPPASYAPFANASIYNYMQWHGSLPHGNILTNDASDRLVHQVLKAQGFSGDDFPVDFRTEKEAQRLDAYDLQSLFPSAYGWTCDTIQLPLPCTGKKCAGGEDSVYHFPVEGFYHRKLLDVICREVASAPNRTDFHLTPFRWWWKDQCEGLESTPERVVDNVYNSDVLIEEHIRLSTAPRQFHPEMEVVVVGLQFWSDSTHVADFGTASMWPAYLAFANQCKYTRGDPRTQSIHHIAYLPKVSTSVTQLHIFLAT